MEWIDTEYATIEHKIYMHQKYIRLFVVETYAKLKPTALGSVMLTLKYPSTRPMTSLFPEKRPTRDPTSQLIFEIIILLCHTHYTMINNSAFEKKCLVFVVR
jgi:hypothetical protein